MKSLSVIIIIFVILLVVFGAITMSIYLHPKVDMTFAENGVAIFKYENNDICQSISNDDMMAICKLFNGKKMFFDNLSCGFTDNVSILINGSEQFCFACDTCPIVYWKSKNKFFTLSESEYNELIQILSEYGFVFPCVQTKYTTYSFFQHVSV